MKRAVLGLASLIAVVGLLATGVVVGLLGSSGYNQALAMPCLPTLNPINGGGWSPVGPEELDEEQAAVASAIIQIGQHRQLPPRAWQVALQAGMTESRLHNLNYGDRDSLGLFQQRPSQGWGTPAQVRDPEYAAGEFYERLVQVPGWRTGRLTEVAQAVQRSGFPELYQQHEGMAVELTAALQQGRTPCAES